MGHPLNSYQLVKHVALGWQEIRNQVFERVNKTDKIFGNNFTLSTPKHKPEHKLEKWLITFVDGVSPSVRPSKTHRSKS